MRSLKINIEQWDSRYRRLPAAELNTLPHYVKPLSEYFNEGNHRLGKLYFDDSVASLQLWCLLLSERQRLWDDCRQGKTLIAMMKDLGTTAVLSYAFDNCVAFYLDGAWWTPSLTEYRAGLLEQADKLGIDDSFCPVRSLLAAVVDEQYYPEADIYISSSGAVCDDLSAVVQRLEELGYSVHFWQIPHRRNGEDSTVKLPGNYQAPYEQIEFVKGQLAAVKEALENLTGSSLDEEKLKKTIRRANRIRRLLQDLRYLVYSHSCILIPAAEMMIAEMLAVHYCSDPEHALSVLQKLFDTAGFRAGAIISSENTDSPVRVFWVNPVADLRMMNLLEDCGAMIAGSDYMFTHSLHQIPENINPLEALARTALSDPMVGSAIDRADKVCEGIERFSAQAVIVSHIPGASHCSVEGHIIRKTVRERMNIPVLEIEVPPVIDSMYANLQTRLEGLVEIVRQRRNI